MLSKGHEEENTTALYTVISSLTIIEDDETCIRYTVLVHVVIPPSLTSPPNITALVLLIFSMMK